MVKCGVKKILGVRCMETEETDKADKADKRRPATQG